MRNKNRKTSKVSKVSKVSRVWETKATNEPKMSEINREVIIKIGCGGMDVMEHFWELGVNFSHSEGHGETRAYDALALDNVDSFY